MLWQAGSIGSYPLAWPRPDGQPIDNDSWSSPSRLLASMNVHYTLSGGWWPTKGVHLPRAEGAGCPRSPIRFDELVDHLSRSCSTHRAPTALLQACCEATGCRPRERIDPEHGLVQWDMPRLLTTFLDSPDFLTR